MKKESKIYVAGHLGMVGSAIVRNLNSKGYMNIIGRSIDELDLLDYEATGRFFKEESPEYVILAAAKVGGIIANNIYRGQFIYENLQIQNNIIHHSYLNKVKKLLFLGSSCIYPRVCRQPIDEEYLLTGQLEYTNEPYAIAKIAGMNMCESYNIQYGTNFISVMPSNLYGENDNYDLEKSHVLPALIRKMHLGQCLISGDWEMIRKDFDKRPVENITGQNTDKEILQMLEKYGIMKEGNTVGINLWGTGSPYREFLNSDDMADASVFIMENIDFKDLVQNRIDNKIPNAKKEIRNTFINIGSGEDITIKDLAYKIKEITGFDGEIHWDTSKPDGTLRKLLNVGKLKALGWKQKITLDEGISTVYKKYTEY